MKLPLTDKHGFRGPVEAAFHACFIQGGFSTPQHEAARMLLSGGVSEQRAQNWMEDENLGVLDLEWDPGQLDYYLSRSQA